TSEVLKRLDAYRAIEIGNLWQRSIFLTAFLILGYTGYGFLVDKMLSSHNFNELRLLHFLACVLSCVNIVFSALWIAMAKGSKAWYEAYENAIQEMELKVDQSYKNVRKSIRLKFAHKDDCFFSMKAGGYSPSKINIALGQVSLVLWSVVVFVHFLILVNNNYRFIGNFLLILLVFLL